MNVPSSTPSDTADDPIDQLQQLEPDDFVNQRGAAAADEQQQQRRQDTARGHSVEPLESGNGRRIVSRERLPDPDRT